MNFLLLDFGASRIKGVVFDLEKKRFFLRQDWTPSPNIASLLGRYELSPMAIQEQFLSILNFYRIEEQVPLAGVFIASQMHGFLFTDEKGNPLSNYVTWQDERSLEANEGSGVFNLVKERLGDSFKSITGLKPNPCYPFFNAVKTAGELNFSGSPRILSLPDWLALVSSVGFWRSDETMLASFGFYDLRRKKVSDELLSLYKDLTGSNLIVNERGDCGEVAGCWLNGQEKIPIFCGVGDQQSALYGVASDWSEAISVNIGTGSQVSAIYPDGDLDGCDFADWRPYFSCRLLKTVTHIPAGRALNVHLDFLNRILAKDWWNFLAQTDLNTVLNSDLIFDLNLFKAARWFEDGGRLDGIGEHNFTVQNYLASLLRCFARQYSTLVNEFVEKRPARNIVLSGGIATRLPILRQLLTHYTGLPVRPLSENETTLLGLAKIAAESQKRRF